MTSFEELEVWKLCRIFRNEIRDLTTKFPGEEKYKLTDQIVRSSRGVTANIAEGFGRFHHQENIQFCRIARGSLYETLDHLICAHDNLYINIEELEILRSKYESCLKLLNGYIGYLKRAKLSQ
jgi:four helix bundle protein